MEYAYVRASTNEDKQDLSRQIRFAHNNGIKDENIFQEYASGAKVERKELNRLLNIVKEGDSIFSSDVSRLTRSLKHLISLVDFAKEKKIKLVFGDFVIDCRNNLSALTEGQLLMLGLVAELTRLIIVENVKDGLETAREHGRIGGQPKLTKDRLFKKNPDFFKYYIQYQNKQITLVELSRLSCISRSSCYNYIKILQD